MVAEKFEISLNGVDKLLNPVKKSPKYIPGLNWKKNRLKNISSQIHRLTPLKKSKRAANEVSNLQISWKWPKYETKISPDIVSNFILPYQNYKKALFTKGWIVPKKHPRRFRDRITRITKENIKI